VSFASREPHGQVRRPGLHPHSPFEAAQHHGSPDAAGKHIAQSAWFRHRTIERSAHCTVGVTVTPAQNPLASGTMQNDRPALRPQHQAMPRTGVHIAQSAFVVQLRSTSAHSPGGTSGVGTSRGEGRSSVGTSTADATSRAGAARSVASASTGEASLASIVAGVSTAPASGVAHTQTTPPPTHSSTPWRTGTPAQPHGWPAVAQGLSTGTSAGGVGDGSVLHADKTANVRKNGRRMAGRYGERIKMSPWRGGTPRRVGITEHGHP